MPLTPNAINKIIMIHFIKSKNNGIPGPKKDSFTGFIQIEGVFLSLF